MRRRQRILFVLICLLLSHPGLTLAASPTVAVSIKPVHSLVAGVMHGVGVPALIVKGSRSPHSYNLKPSDARTLAAADVIVWIGPSLEMFLEKPLSALSGHSRIVTLLEGTSGDPHLWLAPALAATIVERVTTALSQVDPANGPTYARNAQALKTRLKALQVEGIVSLTPVRETPFLVFHDAWGHFAQAFGLSVAGAVAINPERVAGAKRIATIRRLIDDSGARCLFREPQFLSPLLATVLEDHESIRVFELDPLGSALQAGPDLYFKMMGANIEAVRACLQ